MRNLLAIFLALLVPLPAVGGCQYAPMAEHPKAAQQATPEPRSSTEKPTGNEQASAKTETASVNPRLVGKKVVVYMHDGTTHKGKLLELTDDFLRLKMGKPTEKIPLKDIARVERQSSRLGLAVAIAGLAVGAVALVWIAVASSD